MTLDISNAKIPQHIAVIMDGNGRWAKERGLPRTDGHIAGEEALMRWVRRGRELGVKEMSFYTFSTENWSRSVSEVNFLMNLSKKIMRNRADEFIALDCQVKWVGRRNKIWKSVLNELEIIQQKTKHCQSMVINFCINYGGQSELVDTVNNILEQYSAGRIGKIASGKPPKITERNLAKFMYSPSMLPVDLLIRTSGEIRLSNFLLWQLAYSEMVFIDDKWPDVNADTLDRCITEYTGRDRRYGKA